MKVPAPPSVRRNLAFNSVKLRFGPLVPEGLSMPRFIEYTVFQFVQEIGVYQWWKFYIQSCKYHFGPLVPEGLSMPRFIEYTVVQFVQEIEVYQWWKVYIQ